MNERQKRLASNFRVSMTINRETMGVNGPPQDVASDIRIMIMPREEVSEDIDFNYIKIDEGRFLYAREDNGQVVGFRFDGPTVNVNGLPFKRTLSYLLSSNNILVYDSQNIQKGNLLQLTKIYGRTVKKPDA